MICKNCNNEISIQSKFCSLCGMQLKNNKYFVIQLLATIMNTLFVFYITTTIIFASLMLVSGQVFFNGLINLILLTTGCTDVLDNCIIPMDMDGTFLFSTFVNWKVFLIFLFLCIIGIIISIIVLCKKQRKSFATLEILITVIFGISNIYLLFLFFVFKMNYIILLFILLFLIYFIFNGILMLRNKRK